MDGSKLVKFIADLRASDPIAPHDEAFLKSCDEGFACLTASDSSDGSSHPISLAAADGSSGSAVSVAAASVSSDLTPSQIEWLQSALATRWTVVKGTKEDYTINQDGANNYWIALAKDLVVIPGKTYFQLLMPSINHSMDPNGPFTKRHSNIDELRHFYIGEGGKTIYSIPKLIEQCTRNGLLCTNRETDDPRKYKIKPLSLTELLAIKMKGRLASFDAVENPWIYILQKFSPSWSTRGALPEHISLLLFELVGLYFTEPLADASTHNFSQKLLVLEKAIKNCSVNDANCFYGQIIRVGAKPEYLMEVLLDCFTKKPSDLQEKMRGIAAWLCQQNATYVIKSPKLETLYASLHLGSAFSVLDLSRFLSEMYEGSPVEIQLLITSLSTKLAVKDIIDTEIITGLGEIYRARWLKIQGDVDDYTRQQQGKNKTWIRLAQILTSAGYIKSNYYGFLMPTLTHDTDPVQMCCLTEYPLSHYILSEDGKFLILLENSKRNYQINGTFNKCISGSSTEPLTAVELGRVGKAHPSYHKYVELVRYRDIGAGDPPINAATLKAIFTLVNESVTPDGLLWERTPLAPGAEDAYEAFCVFLNNLPADEKDRLLTQQIGIYFREKLVRVVTVKILLEDAQRNKCIAGIGSHLAQLVMDYAPHWKFRDSLEIAMTADQMRKLSSKKMLRMDEEEAKWRLQLIAVSLMTHPFPYGIFNVTGSIGTSTHTMSAAAKRILDIISPLIISGDFKDAVFIYSKIVEIAKIEREKEDKSWIPALARSEVNSIANETFLIREDWFPPLLLLSFFTPLPIVESSAERTYFRLFLQDLVDIYAKTPTEPLREVLINIKFREFLNMLTKDTRAKLLQGLSKTAMPSVPFGDIYKDAITQHLALSPSVSVTRLSSPPAAAASGGAGVYNPGSPLSTSGIFASGGRHDLSVVTLTLPSPVLGATPVTPSGSVISKASPVAAMTTLVLAPSLFGRAATAASEKRPVDDASLATGLASPRSSVITGSA